MALEIKVPSPGESISEVEIGSWFVESGDHVEKDQEIGEIESEKATLPLIAEESGKITLLKEVGETVPVGTVVCSIDTSKAGKTAEKNASAGAATEAVRTEKTEEKTEGKPGKKSTGTEKEEAGKEEVKVQQAEAETEPSEIKEEGMSAVAGEDSKTGTGMVSDKIKTTPVARRMMEEDGLNVDDIVNGLRKITSREVNAVAQSGQHNGENFAFAGGKVSRTEQRSKMSNLRRKLAQRLVAVKNETAMLTTFNEADMSQVIALRKKYQDIFVKKHGIKLGFMSFFTKAVTLALQEFPNVNSHIEGDELIVPDYCDIGIAVQTEKGLMVPVLRNTESQGLADIEKNIMNMAAQARKFRISIEDMSGGTFTITNGGIFGSMLSTPIINPPQAAILGMHNIIERPVVVDGQIVVRPMMYLAISYDHRVIDGRDSVSFLVRVKEYIENPVNMLIGGVSPEKTLLDI